MIRTYETANAWATAHTYKRVLRCELCDYVLVDSHQGPNYDRGRWELKYCPNVIKHPGLRPRLMPSLK